MFHISFKINALILLNCFVLVWCMQVIPEQAEVTYINEKYLAWGKFYVRRYNRQSPYYLNIEGRNKYTWSNNVTVHLIFYEFLHNEYRRSFVEMHHKFCDLVNKEPYFGGVMRQKGITCPAPAKEYHIMNITAPTENFPNVFPFEKGRIEGEFKHTDTGEVLLKAYVNALFKDERKSPKLGKGKKVI